MKIFSGLSSLFRSVCHYAGIELDSPAPSSHSPDRPEKIAFTLRALEDLVSHMNPAYADKKDVCASKWAHLDVLMHDMSERFEGNSRFEKIKSGVNSICCSIWVRNAAEPIDIPRRVLVDIYENRAMLSEIGKAYELRSGNFDYSKVTVLRPGKPPAQLTAAMNAGANAQEIEIFAGKFTKMMETHFVPLPDKAAKPAPAPAKTGMPGSKRRP